MSLPTPTRPLSSNLGELPSGMRLWRFHERGRSGNGFVPGLGDTRFAPLKWPTGKMVPHLYAGTSFDCSAFEYLFHDIDPAAQFKTVPMSQVQKLSVTELELVRSVTVVQLFQPDLMRWGLQRSDLIDTPPSTYDQTRQWSMALHEDVSGAAGLIWVSRKFDQERAMLFFGDRLGSEDLRVVRTEVLDESSSRLEELRAAARRAGITITF